MLAIAAVAASMAADPGFAQNTPPAAEPTPAGAKSEEDLSGKTPPKDERGGKKEAPKGTETGWSGQWKTPEDGKSQASRNEAEGPSVKQPEQGK
jgi:hypothetical protein